MAKKWGKLGINILVSVRKVINPPYSKKDFLIILGTLFILVEIPLTTLGVMGAVDLIAEARAPRGILTVSPNPVSPFTNFTVSGSGFQPRRTLYVGVPGVFPWSTTIPDANGAFSLTYTLGLVPGTYEMWAMGMKGNGTPVLKASTTFTVCATNPC